MAAEVEDVPASEQTAQNEGKSSIYLGSYLLLPLHYPQSPYTVPYMPPSPNLHGPYSFSAATGGGGSPSDMIGWFNSEIEKNAATFIVYYRGLW